MFLALFHDRGVASQPANPILAFTTVKRCVNEGLIVHGRAQKYTERTPRGLAIFFTLVNISHAPLDGITANAEISNFYCRRVPVRFK